MWMTKRLALLVVAGIIGGANLAVAAEGSAAQTPGRAFSVSTTGAGDRAMILIPGLMSDGEVWKDVVEHYASRYQLHVLTIAGFAGVPPVEGPLLAQVRDDLIAYIRAKHLQKPVLVGHSLGAVVALWAASVAPELVGEIVAVDGVPFASALMNPSAVAGDMEPYAERMRTVYHALTPEQLAAQTRIALAGMISNPAQIEPAVEWAKRSSPASAGQAVYDLMTTDLRPTVASITSDVLLVAAAKAFASNASRLDMLLKAYEDQVTLVPRHRVIAAAQALHFVMLDDPVFLLATMDDFLVGRRSR